MTMSVRTASGSYVPDRGDVIRVSFNPQAGHEQAGFRPALVLSKASYNNRVGLAQVVPITNQQKNYPFEVPIPPGGGITGVVLADQAKSIDWRARKAEFLCRLDPETVNEVVGRSLALIDPDGVFGRTDPPDQA